MGTDLDKELEQLKDKADSTVLQSIVFTEEMARNVRNNILKRNRKPSFQRVVISLTAGCLSILFVLFAGSMFLPIHSVEGPVSSSVKWEPSPIGHGTHQGNPFSYFGEKPVRIITGELYENQGQKAIWLLNGTFDAEAEITATNERGENFKLGDWKVGGQLYDADAHFPASLALPEPGVWKLEVVTKGEPLGHVYVEVKPGVSAGNRSLFEGLIVPYLETNKEFAWVGEKRFASIHLFGIDGVSADKKTGYAWVLVESYVRKGDKLVTQAGFSAPMVFEIAYVNNDYQVVSHQMPKDGQEYWPSIEKMFPKKQADYLKKRKSIEVNELEKLNKNKAAHQLK